MGTHAVPTSRSLGRLLRRRRAAMGLTLREASERLARSGERIPVSTLARIEKGDLDPGVRRLHVLLRLYDIPPHLVAELLEMERLATGEVPSGDLESLLQDGVAAWQSGDIGRGLAHLFAVREQVPDDEASRHLRQRAILNFAVLARRLGRSRLAKQIVDELLLEPPLPVLMPRVLLGAAGIWLALGSPDVARGLVLQARERLQPGQVLEEGWILQQQGMLDRDLGRIAESEAAIRRALQCFEATGNTYALSTARMALAKTFYVAGRVDEAIATISAQIEEADAAGLAVPANGGRVELGRMLRESGREAEALAPLYAALADAARRGDRGSEFYAHYHLWKAYQGLGDPTRAGLEFEAARHFVQFVDDRDPETEEVRGWAPEGGTPCVEPGGSGGSEPR